tara:strand:- start:246 stop:368 length:123 start_codon:yes stop_codon:yes gene_type:complete
MIIRLVLINEQWVVLLASFYSLEFKTWCLITEIKEESNNG